MSFHYEILHAPDATDLAEQLISLVDSAPQLRRPSRWRNRAVPNFVELYVCIVIVSEGLEHDMPTMARLSDIHARSLDILPVLRTRDGYHFERAPHPAIERNLAVGLDQRDALISSLLDVAGLSHFGREGQVFISYARADGDQLARTLDQALTTAGFRCVRDQVDVSPGREIQPELARKIASSSILVLVDSQGASASLWVGREIDLARAHHIPVVAVSPTPEDVDNHFGYPHIHCSGPERDAVAAVIAACRRITCHRSSFERRARRAVSQICNHRGWRARADNLPWQVDHPPLEIRCHDTEPPSDRVLEFADHIQRAAAGFRGILIGGTKPYNPTLQRAFTLLGREFVRVTPLAHTASCLSALDSPLRGKRIFLSAALPDKPIDGQTNPDWDQANYTLGPFIAVFVQTMFALGATLVYGGHPSITPMIHRAVTEFGLHDNSNIELYQARWWMQQGALVDELNDRSVFRPTFHGDGTAIDTDLAAMRSAMINPTLDAAVFVGGKLDTSKTKPPGILDEHVRFVAACPDKPAFVLGLAGGAAASLGLQGSQNIDVMLASELLRLHDPDLATALIVAGMTDAQS